MDEVKREVSGFYRKDLPEPIPGVHRWVLVGYFRVAEPEHHRFVMDGENLLTIDGPICFWCGVDFEDWEGHSCPGPEEINDV